MKVLLKLEHDRVDGATEVIKLVPSKSGTVASFKETH